MQFNSVDCFCAIYRHQITYCPLVAQQIYSSFSQLGNSGNSAISVKGKGLANIKMYVERKVFSKG